MHVLPVHVERPGGGDDPAAFATELNLLPEQTGAWTAFIATWRRAEHDCRKMESIARDRLSNRPPELPEALLLEAQKLTVRLDAARRLECAARSLFACLSARQKTKVRPLLARVCIEAVASQFPAPGTDGPVFDPLLRVPPVGDTTSAAFTRARHRPRARRTGRPGPA